MKKIAKNTHSTKEGLFFIFENGNLNGMFRWVNEVETRKIPAIIKVNESFIDEHGDLVKEISRKGFEIAGGHLGRFLWDEAYDYQIAEMARLKNKLERCTGKRMKIFGAKRLSYNEHTARIAKELQIDYLLVLGTSKTRTIIYQPIEYGVRLVSLSSITAKSGDTATICDHAFLAHGETPQSFRKTIFSVSENKIALVS